MNPKKQVNEWLIQYGNSQGKFFRLNEKGVFAAKDENDQEFVVDIPENSSYVYFCAPIVTLNNAENRKEDLERILKWNLWNKETQGGTLGFDEISQRILFHQRFHIENIDKDVFCQEFDKFIATVYHIQSLWEAYRQNWKPSESNPDAINMMLRI